MRKSLTQRDVMKIVGEHNRNIKAAAQQIASEEFMGVPVEDIPTLELEEMEETIETLRKKIGKPIGDQN